MFRHTSWDILNQDIKQIEFIKNSLRLSKQARLDYFDHSQNEGSKLKPVHSP